MDGLVVAGSIDIEEINRNQLPRFLQVYSVQYQKKWFQFPGPAAG